MTENPLKASIGSQITTRTESTYTPFVIGGIEYHVFWLVIDGPIGAGKTVLMNLALARLRDEYPLETILEVPENIDAMMESGLFQKAQLDPERYAYRVQTMWFQNRTEAFLEAWEALVAKLEMSPPRIGRAATLDPPRIFVVSERSILSDPIFMHAQLRCAYSDQSEMDDYSKLHATWVRIYPFKPHLILFCKPFGTPGGEKGETAAICQARIKERNREAEQELVTVKYNQIVLDLYESYMDVARGGYLVTERGKLWRIPVIEFDTTMNYRDDHGVGRSASAHILRLVSSVPRPKVISHRAGSYRSSTTNNNDNNNAILC